MNDARLVKMLTPWERRHARLFAGMRIGGGVSLLIIVAILLGHNVWWGVLLLPVVALLFYSAYRFPRASRANDGFDRREGTALAPLPGGADRV